MNIIEKKIDKYLKEEDEFRDYDYIKKPIKHNWTKSTLPRAAETFMDSMMDAYWNYDKSTAWKKIAHNIEMYTKIYGDVSTRK